MARALTILVVCLLLIAVVATTIHLHLSMNLAFAAAATELLPSGYRTGNAAMRLAHHSRKVGSALCSAISSRAHTASSIASFCEYRPEAN